jgi:hypothetical protein
MPLNISRKGGDNANSLASKLNNTKGKDEKASVQEVYYANAELDAALRTAIHSCIVPFFRAMKDAKAS